jgi:hypothetical protein
MFGIEGCGHNLWWDHNKHFTNKRLVYDTYPAEIIHTLRSYPHKSEDREKEMTIIINKFMQWYKFNYENEHIKLIIQFRNLIDCNYSCKKRFTRIYKNENHKEIIIKALKEIKRQTMQVYNKCNADYRILNYDRLIKNKDLSGLKSYTGLPDSYFDSLIIKQPTQHEDTENVGEYFDKHFDMQDFYFDDNRQLN